MNLIRTAPAVSREKPAGKLGAALGGLKLELTKIEKKQESQDAEFKGIKAEFKNQDKGMELMKLELRKGAEELREASLFVHGWPHGPGKERGGGGAQAPLKVSKATGPCTTLSPARC